MEVIMKIVSSILIAAFATVMTAGCSNRVYVQRDESTDLAKARTYAWVRTRANKDDNRHVTAFAQQDIHSAVDAQLAKEGWRQVTNDPDVLVSYDILVERNKVRQSEPVYTRPFTRVYYNPWLRRWGTIYYPSEFIGYDNYSVPVKQGTVTITMNDANTDKTLWQAWTTEDMQDNKLTSTEVNKAVKNIFKKFNP
jgi:hypothetical protein